MRRLQAHPIGLAWEDLTQAANPHTSPGPAHNTCEINAYQLIEITAQQPWVPTFNASTEETRVGLQKSKADRVCFD